jgi:hypothetical protein
VINSFFFLSPWNALTLNLDLVDLVPHNPCQLLSNAARFAVARFLDLSLKTTMTADIGIVAA